MVALVENVAIMATLVEFASNLFVYFSPKAIMQSIDKKTALQTLKSDQCQPFCWAIFARTLSAGHVWSRVKKIRHYSTRMAAPSGGQKVNYKFRLAAIDTSKFGFACPVINFFNWIVSCLFIFCWAQVGPLRETRFDGSSLNELM